MDGFVLAGREVEDPVAVGVHHRVQGRDVHGEEEQEEQVEPHVHRVEPQPVRFPAAQEGTGVQATFNGLLKTVKA